MVALTGGPVDPNATADNALAVSADGNVIVGWGTQAHEEAYRWTEATGVVGLGDLPGGDEGSVAWDVSADGETVVGYSSSETGTEAYRWTAATGMEALGGISGAPVVASEANGVSDDGSTVVGLARGIEGFEAFLWNDVEGMTGLGDLDGGVFSSYATATSSNGAIVVGAGMTSRGSEAFRWSAADGMAGLDTAGDWDDTVALDVSADGSVVVGRGYQGAFVWTSATGLQVLQDVLLANGATGLEGWYLFRAGAISADGRYVVGDGINPSGYYEAFIADLTPVPIPTVGWMLAPLFAAIGLTQRRPRKNAHL